jgi:hypothetical protein
MLILNQLEQIVRDCHPYARTFKTAQEKYDEAEKNFGKPPQFSVCLYFFFTIRFFLACSSNKPRFERRRYCQPGRSHTRRTR